MVEWIVGAVVMLNGKRGSTLKKRRFKCFELGSVMRGRHKVNGSSVDLYTKVPTFGRHIELRLPAEDASNARLILTYGNCKLFQASVLVNVPSD